MARKSDDTTMTFSVDALMLRQLLSGDPRGCGSLDDACRHGYGRWLPGSLARRRSRRPAARRPCRRRSRRGRGHRQQPPARCHLDPVRDAGPRAGQREGPEGARRRSRGAADRRDRVLNTQAPLQTRIGAIMDAGWKQQTLALLQKETSLPRLEAILARQFDALFAQIDAMPEIAALRKAEFDKQRAYISAQNKLLAESCPQGVHGRLPARAADAAARLDQVRGNCRAGRAQGRGVHRPRRRLHHRRRRLGGGTDAGRRDRTRDSRTWAALEFDADPQRRAAADLRVRLLLQGHPSDGVVEPTRRRSHRAVDDTVPSRRRESWNTRAVHVGQFRVSIPTCPWEVFPAGRSPPRTGPS